MVVTTTPHVINKISCLPTEPSTQNKFIGALLEMRGSVGDPKGATNSLKEFFRGSESGFRDRIRAEVDLLEA